MGFFSGLKQAGSYVFNFRVNKWIDYDQLKNNTKRLADIAKETYVPQQAERSESFDEALKRLNLTEAQLQERLNEFTKLLIIYLFAAALLFAYTIYVLYAYKNWMGFFMGFALTVLALTHAFRYHFWIFQIKNKKLGCSLKDWFLDIH